VYVTVRIDVYVTVRIVVRKGDPTIKDGASISESRSTQSGLEYGSSIDLTRRHQRKRAEICRQNGVSGVEECVRTYAVGTCHSSNQDARASFIDNVAAYDVVCHRPATAVHVNCGFVASVDPIALYRIRTLPTRHEKGYWVGHYLPLKDSSGRIARLRQWCSM